MHSRKECKIHQKGRNNQKEPIQKNEVIALIGKMEIPRKADTTQQRR